VSSGGWRGLDHSGLQIRKGVVWCGEAILVTNHSRFSHPLRNLPGAVLSPEFKKIIIKEL
jgi:hypothetical protein